MGPTDNNNLAGKQKIHSAAATVGPDVDLDGGDPTFLVMSLNGLDATVTLDGTVSYDPDDDYPLTYEWFEELSDGRRIPIWSGDGDSGATHATSLPIGSRTIVLRVTDYLGLAGDEATIQVEVVTPKKAIGILEMKVNGSLDSDWPNPLWQKHALNVNCTQRLLLSNWETSRLLAPSYLTFRINFRRSCTVFASLPTSATNCIRWRKRSA